MTQQSQEKPESVWKDPAFLGEAISGSVLALWLVVSVMASLNPYAVVVVGLVLYGTLMYSLVKRKSGEVTMQIELEKIRAQTEQNKAWMEANIRPLTDEWTKKSLIQQARTELCMAVIGTLQDAAENPSVPEAERKVWKEAVERVHIIRRASGFL
jgi:hypothetical protein